MRKIQEQLSNFEDFENRRRFPRLKMNLSVAVTGQDEEKFKGIIHDISPDGVQVRYGISDGEKLFSEKEGSTEDLHATASVLQFDLAYGKTVAHVRIYARCAYLRPIDDDTLASGMFFSEENLEENKKISDFLFYQLQLSYVDIEQKKNDHTEHGEETGPGIRQTIIETRVQTNGPISEKLITGELEDLILQLDYPKEHLEPLKEIMYRVMASLKVIQEITRHIDERISLIENKISRGGRT